MTTRKPTAKASGIRPRRRNGHSPTTTSPTAVLVRIERKTHERPRFPLFILYPSVRTQPDKQKQWRGDQKRSWLSLSSSLRFSPSRPHSRNGRDRQRGERHVDKLFQGRSVGTERGPRTPVAVTGAATVRRGRGSKKGGKAAVIPFLLSDVPALPS